MTNRYLSTQEAACYTKLGKSTLERMRIEGNGPTFIRATPTRVVYSVDDLDAYLVARRHQSTAAADRSAD
jgi:hypothetical protein